MGRTTNFRCSARPTCTWSNIIPQKIKTKKAGEEFGDWVTYHSATQGGVAASEVRRPHRQT